MKLRAMVRERRASHADGTDGLESRVVEVEADTYEAAYSAMLERTPPGWIQLWVDVDRG